MITTRFLFASLIECVLQPRAHGSGPWTPARSLPRALTAAAAALAGTAASSAAAATASTLAATTTLTAIAATALARTAPRAA